MSRNRSHNEALCFCKLNPEVTFTRKSYPRKGVLSKDSKAPAVRYGKPIYQIGKVFTPRLSVVKKVLAAGGSNGTNTSK